MTQKYLKTYSRRTTTRESGYHTCKDTTGGECRIVYSEKYICASKNESFIFHRAELHLVKLFEKEMSIIAFGGYIFSQNRAEVQLEISYKYENVPYNYSKPEKIVLEEGCWSNIGFHVEHNINKDMIVHDVFVKMTVNNLTDKVLEAMELISFNFDIVNKDEFLDTSCTVSFYKKTYMHVPYLYYFDSMLSFDMFLVNRIILTKGQRIVLKSCNRCGRYLPINIDNEMKTLSFSLHCKKRAPCTHSTFSSYRITNISELEQNDLNKSFVQSTYGHQLECKACKKFFVNAPLNPQRTPQQRKEDGLRRRAIEVLVNSLLGKRFVHFEYKEKQEDFSELIWKKFNKRCFKCGPESDPIKLIEMELDHTMPLAYLYRLDETATCLCKSHNSQKSDSFPCHFYREDELIQLSNITKLPLDVLSSNVVNQEVLEKLLAEVVWFYDIFLMATKYQKDRDGIKTSKKINNAVKRVVGVNLEEQYKTIKGQYPSSV